MFSRTVARALGALTFVVAAGSCIAEEHGPHWSYGGATGPTRWPALEPEFSTCGTGREQSPIDIRQDAVQKTDLAPIRFAYQPGPLKVVDNGHTIQVNYAPGSFIEVGGHQYQLVQFHFHKPSEERIDGKRAAMVVHLVHRDAQGQLAVVAVLLEPGAVNPMVALLWNNVPARKGAETEAKGVQVDAAALLPTNRAYYTFEGSLTTPPCSEKVTWFVLAQPSTLSFGEIERFAHAYPMNARPTQPLNGRVIRASR